MIQLVNTGVGNAWTIPEIVHNRIIKIPGRKRPDQTLFYSAFKLFTGLAIAAFIDWKLTISIIVIKVPAPAEGKTHHGISVWQYFLNFDGIY